MQSFPRVSFVAALILLVALASSSEGQEGRAIARDAFPSVALIVAETGKAGLVSLGSGFFVENDLLVTNYHVIKGSTRLRVKLVGQRQPYRATVVGTDAQGDLALLMVTGIEAPPLSLGDFSEVAVGDEIYAIGNPLGLEATLSQGIVSGIRKIGGNRYLQITAPISHGSSGGPVLNKSGEVIGVTVGALREGQNLNFAIPVSKVIALMETSGRTKDRGGDALDEVGSPRRDRLGKSKLDSSLREVIDAKQAEVRERPNSAEAHFALAETLKNFSAYEGILENAIREYRIVIRMTPHYAPAYCGLGDCYLDAFLGDAPDSSEAKSHAEEAIANFKQAIRLSPDYADAHASLALLYESLHRYDEALAAYRIAISLEPRDPWHYFHVGLVYENAGNCAQAIPNFQRAIELANIEPAYDGLLRCFSKTNIVDGIEYFQTLAIKLANTTSHSCDCSADSLGRVVNVCDCSASTSAHYALGRLYLHSGNTRAALEQYKILKGYGKGTPAKFAEALFNAIYK